MFAALSLTYIAICITSMIVFAGKALKKEQSILSCFFSTFIFLLPIAFMIFGLFYFYGFEKIFSNGKHTLLGGVIMYLALVVGTPILSAALVYKERHTL